MSKKKNRSENYLAKILRVFLKKPFSDDGIKLIFSNKQVLAHLIRDITPELQDMSYEQIEQSINKTVVSRGATQNDYLETNTESIEIGEAKIKYDVRFNVGLPDTTQERYEIHFDIEGQGRLHPGYRLPKRMILYICRLLSSQIKSLNQAKKYNHLQPACSIWICHDKTQRNPNGSIAIWELRENTDFRYGEPVFNDKDFSYMRIVVITVPYSESTIENHTLEFLRNLFSADLERKLEKLKNMGIKVDTKFKGEVESMTSLIVEIAKHHAEKMAEEHHEEKAELLAVIKLKDAEIAELKAQVESLREGNSP